MKMSSKILSLASEKLSTVASVENLSQFLDDFKSEKGSKDETTKIIMPSMNEDVRDVTKKCYDTFIWKVIKEYDDNSNEQSDLLIHEGKSKFKKVPALAYLDIPLLPDVLQLIVREVVLLSSMFPKKNII